MPVSFLIFIVDQLSASHLGCYGNPLIATPHIDSLARDGWCATECHVATPLCMPNRASLMTGRMPSAHGVRHNGIPLSLGARTFVEQLRLAGYDTALLGKSHLQNITDKPALADPRQPRLPADAERPYPGNYLQERPSTWREAANFEVELPFYGFGHVELAIGHGDNPDGHYRRWLNQAHPQAAASAGPARAWPTPGYRLAECGQAWRTRLPEELHPASWVADRTMAHIRRAAGQGRPFLSYCSFPDPHSPYTPPGRYWDMYKPEDMLLPPSYANKGNPPPHLKWLQEERDQGRAVKNTMGCFGATPREVQEALALNFGSIAFIDAQVGRVLAELRALGRDQDTVVIFTSDHGEFAGDHQLLLKGPLHYRSLIRTPLIWRDPQRGTGGVSDELISTIDIAPSILERAGVAGYNGMQGVSFLPSLGGRPGARTRLLIEEEGQRSSYGFDTPVRMRTLLTRQHRLSFYEGADWGEIYDRQADPLEHHNLWDEPACAPARERLLAQMGLEMLSFTDRSTAPTALA